MTNHGEWSAKPAIATTMIGSSAHFAARTIRRFGHTAVSLSASGEQRM